MTALPFRKTGTDLYSALSSGKTNSIESEPFFIAKPQPLPNAQPADEREFIAFDSVETISLLTSSASALLESETFASASIVTPHSALS